MPEVKYKVQVVTFFVIGVSNVEEKLFDSEDEAKSFVRRFNRENMNNNLRNYDFATYIGEVK